MARWYICALTVLIGTVVVLAEKPDPDQTSSLPKSPQALAAIKHAEETIQAIKASCHKQILTTRQTEATQLEEAMATATKAADLDEALRIRAAIKSVTAENHKLGEDDPNQKYVGFWRFHDNQSNGYILFSDGNARITYNSTGKGTWSVHGKEVRVDWGGGTEDGFIQEDTVWVHRIYNNGKVVKTLPGEVDFPK